MPCGAGRGVDLILDCVGASHWEQNIDALVTDGRWVLYGSMGKAHLSLQEDHILVSIRHYCLLILEAK